MHNEIKQILEAVKSGELPVDEALLKIKTQPFEDIGYAKVDLHRKVRQGAAEVIYGAGKTAEQIIGIADTLRTAGQETILITRLSPEKAEIPFLHILPKTYSLYCPIPRAMSRGLDT